MMAGEAIGSWWPIRNVPKSEIWAGDGFGIMLFAFTGLIIGAVVGVAGAALVLFLTRKRSDPMTRQEQRAEAS